MTYLLNEDYKTAVGKHIRRMLAINEKAKEKNQEIQGSLKRFLIENMPKNLHPINLLWETLYW